MHIGKKLNYTQNRLLSHAKVSKHSIYKMFSLGTLLMAFSGRRTRTVRMAERLIFCRSSEYSTILGTQTDTGVKGKKNDIT